jgi:Pectate lyase superfamily protein
MNLNTTTISAIHASGLSVDSDIYFTTDTAEKKFWRIDNYDISSLDDGEKVLINGVGQRFKPFVQDYVNAKWFGAKGDGVTDDKVAIQAAVDFAILYHMGEILFPAGTYNVSNTIEIPITNFVTDGAITIKGVGKKSTIFQGITSNFNFSNTLDFFGEAEPVGFYIPNLLSPPPPDTWPVFHVKADPTLNSYVSFEHLSVRGNNFFKKGWYTFKSEKPKVNYYWLDQSIYELTGIKLELTAIFHLEDVEIINCHKCLHCIGALVFNINNFVIGGAYGGSESYCGIYTEHGTFSVYNIYSNAITLTNGRITYCAHKGIDFGQGSLLTIRSVDFEQNGSLINNEQGNPIGDIYTGAVFIRNDVNQEQTVALINIYDCWFEANKGYTFYTVPEQNTILNFYGSHFNAGGGYTQYQALGVSLDIRGGSNSDVKNIKINGCNSLLTNFIINANHSVIISSNGIPTEPDILHIPKIFSNDSINSEHLGM